MNTEAKTEETPLVDGIKVVDKPRLAVVKTDPIAIAVLLGCTALLAIGIAFVLTHYERTRVVAESVLPVAQPRTVSTADEPTQTTARDLIFERWNFRASLSKDWVKLRQNTTLPPQATNALHTYTRPGTSCTIAYAEFPRLVHTDEYPQTTYSTDVRAEKIFMGRVERRIPPLHASSSAVRPADTAYVPHEIALSYQPLYYDNGTDDTTRNTWILFSSDTTPLRMECHDDFVALVQSFEPYYDTHTLKPRDTGLLYIEKHATLGTLLLFRDTTTQFAKVVSVLDTGSIYKPTYRENTLYYVSSVGALDTYHLFADNTSTAPHLPLTNGASVNDFFVTHDAIYYLFGAWCNTYMADCDLTLAEYNMQTATSTTLAEHVTDRTILGLDTNGILYLAYHEGDAGVGWGALHTYDPATEAYEEQYTYTVQGDDPEHEAQLADITDQIQHKNIVTPSLTLDTQTLTPGPLTFEGVVTARKPVTIPSYGQ